MNRKYIYDHHVVERYLADQLDDAERQAFEAYYVEHPEVVADLESVARLKVGLAALRDQNELTPLLQSRRSPRRLMAIAAAVAVVAIGALTFFIAPRAPQPILAATAPSSIAATYDVLRTRGASDDALIELPSSPHAIELRVLPETDSATYTLTLHRIADGGHLEQLASLTPIAAGVDGFVVAYLNSGELSKGRYQLVLRDANADAAAAESRFTLTLIEARSAAD